MTYYNLLCLFFSNKQRFVDQGQQTKRKFTLAMQNCLRCSLLSCTGVHTLQGYRCLHPPAYNKRPRLWSFIPTSYKMHYVDMTWKKTEASIWI